MLALVARQTVILIQGGLNHHPQSLPSSLLMAIHRMPFPLVPYLTNPIIPLLRKAAHHLPYLPKSLRSFNGNHPLHPSRLLRQRDSPQSPLMKPLLRLLILRLISNPSVTYVLLLPPVLTSAASSQTAPMSPFMCLLHVPEVQVLPQRLLSGYQWQHFVKLKLDEVPQVLQLHHSAPRVRIYYNHPIPSKTPVEGDQVPAFKHHFRQRTLALVEPIIRVL